MAAPALPTILVACGTTFTLSPGFSLPVRVSCAPPDAEKLGGGGGIVITLRQPDHVAQFQPPPGLRTGEAITLRTSADLLAHSTDIGQIVTDLTQAGSPVTVWVED